MSQYSIGKLCLQKLVIYICHQKQVLGAGEMAKSIYSLLIGSEFGSQQAQLMVLQPYALVVFNQSVFYQRKQGRLDTHSRMQSLGSVYAELTESAT